MSTITKEQLRERAREKVKSLEFAVTQKAFADSRADLEVELELARIALASLEAEPVAYIGERMLEDLIDGARSCGRIWPEVVDKMSGEDRIPLFTAPPDPVSVPDAMDVLGGVCCEVSYADGWNACRAAMLQGADGNSPVIPDGWVACSERMPEQFVEVLVCTEDGGRYVAGLNKSMAWDDGDFFDDIQYVTHWMPLPAAP